MIDLAAAEGYQGASIAQVSSRAGVSSATFYEQFAGKEECMLVAYRTAGRRILDQMRPVESGEDCSEDEWAEAALAAYRRLFGALQRDPNCGRVLLIEALAGGSQVGEERKRVVAEFERRTQDLLDSTPREARTLDVPVVALVGAIRSIVVRHLRTHTEDQLPLLADDLMTWVRSYGRPAGSKRWSTGPRALLPAESVSGPTRPGAPPRALTRLPRGRHGLPAGVVARSQRTRIIYGTAEVMMAKGYGNATVADIVARAGVARDVFYEHFTDKQHAFLEAQQHPTQHILDAVAAAHFAADEWPERLWSGLQTLLQLIAENPALSHLRLVECYAAGPAAIRRAEEITRSFTIFLEEGYSYRPAARELPHVCSRAITGALFEVIQRDIARGETAALRRQLPRLVYIAIAPFTGPDEAIELVEQISATQAIGPRPSRASRRNVVPATRGGAALEPDG
jgi:AcrR family transcriptional regulator